MRAGAGRLGAGALALALVLGAGRSARAELTTSQQAVIRSVDAHYNRLTTLRADFVETYSGMGMHRREAGTLLLSKSGGKMRWSYTEPAGKVFVLDGKYAWSYAPGDAQAQRTPAKQMEDMRSPLRLLLGHTQLEKELTGLTVRQEETAAVIRGVPKGQEQRLSAVELQVRADGTIERLRLEEMDGAVTEFVFRGQVENVPVRAEDFVFTPPVGVPVVEGMPPI